MNVCIRHSSPLIDDELVFCRALSFKTVSVSYVTIELLNKTCVVKHRIVICSLTLKTAST